MTQLMNADYRSLRDESDIRALIHRFVQGADSRDIEMMLSCLSDDGIVSFNGGELILNGREELHTWLIGLYGENGVLSPGARSTHMMANTLVDLEGDRATARTRGVSFSAVAADTIVTRGIHYLDRFARIDGHWKLVHRQHFCDWQMEGAGVRDAPMLT